MTIIIPAYKPDEKLIRLLEELCGQEKNDIIVVNDGSGEAFDPIFKQVREMNVTLLVHPENRGKGAAMKTAFRYCLEHSPENEVFCTADADGQHLPKDIAACLREAELHPEALVLGARSFRGNVPARSLVGNTVTRWSFHLLMGARVYDTQTGLRAFSYRLLPEMLSVAADRYEYEMQILCNAARKKIPIREVEIETVYIEENKSSHFHPLRDASRVYGLLLKNAFGRLFQFLCFLLSSCFAFVVDGLLYMLLFHLVFPLVTEDLKTVAFLSLLTARVTSSVVNFLMNRKLVFQNLLHPIRSFLLYGLLVVGIFFVNHALNTLFLIRLGFHELLSLLAAQLICFPVSFLIQKYIVFPKQKEKK
ncbi:MAG: bifunctional glycosyltransferase family 2/GtrA family protein [Clostridia bacterium]|nr:bifunctional glycosyltransferase family 2/GtrA family protein [Clostridia bacterium]